MRHKIVWNLTFFVHFILCNSEEIWQSYSIFFLILFSQCSKQMQTTSPCARWSCLYLLMFPNTTKGWRMPRIVWTCAGVQTILGACHRLVIIFSENTGFYVALPIMVQMTRFFFCTLYSLVVRLLWNDPECRHGLCTFPNMVSNVNTMRKSEKIWKKRRAMM